MVAGYFDFTWGWYNIVWILRGGWVVLDWFGLGFGLGVWGGGFGVLRFGCWGVLVA